MAWRWGIAFFMVTWVYLIVKGDMEMYNSSEIFDFSIRPRDICGNDVRDSCKAGSGMYRM